MPARLWLPARRHLGAFVAQTPALRAILSTATRLPDGDDTMASRLAEVFVGLPSILPQAALSRRIDAPDDAGGRWLRADPCHLRVEIAGVRMLACGDLRLSPEELQGYAAAVRPLFDDAGWRFDAAHAQRWYARPADADPAIGGEAPEHVLGAYIDSALPSGEAGRVTRRWLNELQMALHEHPLNRVRRERGWPEVNSLWLHGDGVAPASLSAQVDALWSQDALVRGCAAISSVRVLDAMAGGWSSPLVDARPGDADSARAVAMLLSKRVAVDVVLASGERFAWRPWHRLRFWRREPD